MKSQRLVLDSYALIAFFEGETGADIVEQALDQSGKGESTILMSVVNLGEVYYSMYRAKGKKGADGSLDILDQLSITLVPADKEATLAAAKIKATHAVAYGDCFAAVLAIQNNCEVLTGDREFEKISEVSVRWLT